MNNKTPARIRHDIATSMTKAFVALLKFEDFIKEVFPVEQHLADFCCSNVSPGAKRDDVGNSVGLFYCFILPCYAILTLPCASIGQQLKHRESSLNRIMF